MAQPTDGDKKMTIRMGLGALALVATLPAFAASTTFTGKAEIALRHQGFTANEAARIAHEAARHYRGAAAAKFTEALQHLPAMPKKDYDGAALKPRVQAAYARVLTYAFTKAEGVRDLAATCRAFTKAVNAGTEPQATARLVVQGLADGLRGRSLAELTHHYTVRIQSGMSQKAAYHETLASSATYRSSPVGQPTGMNPTPGAMGANVNGMGNAPAGGMGAGSGAGSMSGPGGAGAGAGAGGGSMGQP